MESMEPLIFGYTAAELWPTTNLVLPSFALLMFAPRWRYTPILTLVSPIIHATIYTLSMISIVKSENSPQMDYNTFEGVINVFQNHNIVFAGWTHYLVHDLLIARWIVSDSMARGGGIEFHMLVLVPLLILALMASPVAWLLYVVIVRPMLLSVRKRDDIKDD